MGGMAAARGRAAGAGMRARGAVGACGASPRDAAVSRGALPPPPPPPPPQPVPTPPVPPMQSRALPPRVTTA